jgi:hypothetical protein
MDMECDHVIGFYADYDGGSIYTLSDMTWSSGVTDVFDHCPVCGTNLTHLKRTENEKNGLIKVETDR